MPTVLITGANRGIGFEFARQYRADGWRVIATVRDPKQATHLSDLGVELHALQLTDVAAIQQLGTTLRNDAIDVFIANAGIYEGPTLPLAQATESLWIETFRINTIAPLMLANALHASIARSEHRKMVAVSSLLGSISLNGRPGHYPYRTSKAALNAGWRAFALENKDVIAALLNPGWVRTDMGGAKAPLTAEQSAAGMRNVIAKLTPADTGKWFDYLGADVSW